MLTAPVCNLRQIEEAAQLIYQVFPATPQYHWPLLSQRLGCNVWIKHENYTPVGAFKVRGGLVYMEHLKREQPGVSHVVTATRGNHGQSIALAASRHGVKATILVPEANSLDKNRAMSALGGHVIKVPGDFQNAIERAHQMARDEGAHFIASYHPWLVQGVSTYPWEFFKAAPALDTVYVPIGLGSGICSFITVRDLLGLKTEIVGVVAQGADAYARSLEAGHCVSTESAITVADGMSCRTPNPEAFAVIQQGVSRIVRVSDEAVLTAMAMLFHDTHNVAEGAGASALAALLGEREQMQGKTVGLPLCGANVDAEVFQKALAMAL